MELALWVGIGHALTSPNLLQRAEQGLSVDVLSPEHGLELRILEGRQQHVLCRGVFVFERLGFLPGPGEKVAQTTGEPRLGPTCDLWHSVQDGSGRSDQPLDVGPRLLQNRWGQTVRLAQQLKQEVLGVNLRVASVGRVLLACEQRLSRLRCQSI